jgi:bacteriocin-like protein
LLVDINRRSHRFACRSPFEENEISLEREEFRDQEIRKGENTMTEETRKHQAKQDELTEKDLDQVTGGAHGSHPPVRADEPIDPKVPHDDD